MQIEALKLLGLPVLEAMQFANKITLDKIITLLRSTPAPTRIELNVFNDQTPFTEIFHFPAVDEFPLELKAGFADYANRLAGEKMKLEQAIEELRLESFGHN